MPVCQEHQRLVAEAATTSWRALHEPAGPLGGEEVLVLAVMGVDHTLGRVHSPTREFLTGIEVHSKAAPLMVFLETARIVRTSSTVAIRLRFA